jgi:hypothetical protein
LRYINGRKLVDKQAEVFVSGLDKYVNTEGVNSKLVNIPTIITGLNEDGTIMQQEIEPNAYEVIDQNKGFTD